MSTPAVAVPGEVIQPAATATGLQSAVFGVANVLKEIIHSLPAAFPSENLQLAAAAAVDKWANAVIPKSAQPALADGNQRAAVEDVTLRIPPQGVAYAVPSNVPQIDYNQLAAAIVRLQQQANSAPAPADETAQESVNEE